MGINNAYESLPAREVWIEIQSRIDGAHRVVGHFPQGKCGLKFRHIESFARELPSLPASCARTVRGHFPQGKCGLKLTAFDGESGMSGHFPQGKCGLKFLLLG